MKEVERVITMQVTIINKMTDEEADMLVGAQDDAVAAIKHVVKHGLGADDALVTIQDFVRDK